MSIFAGLLDPTIKVMSGDPRANWPTLLPAEEAALRGAVESRLLEFRAGRALARDAMRALGAPGCALPVMPDRAPAWPEGLVGGITHCADLCAVAVGRSDQGWLSVGIDLEPNSSLPSDLVAEICGAEEREWLDSLPPRVTGRFARLIFSIKECVYKCQYPLSRRLLDFAALTIGIDAEGGRFTAHFNADAAPFARGDMIRGRFAMDAEHIATAVALRREDVAGRTLALAYKVVVHG